MEKSKASHDSKFLDQMNAAFFLWGMEVCLPYSWYVRCGYTAYGSLFTSHRFRIVNSQLLSNPRTTAISTLVYHQQLETHMSLSKNGVSPHLQLEKCCASGFGGTPYNISHWRRGHFFLQAHVQLANSQQTLHAPTGESICALLPCYCRAESWCLMMLQGSLRDECFLQ